MSRKKEVPTDNTAAPVTAPAAQVTAPAAEVTAPASESKRQSEAKEFLKELDKQVADELAPPAVETPKPFALSFKNVSALEFNFLSAKADILGVQHLLRFAGLLGTEKQKCAIGKNLIFETRAFEDEQEPKYLFEICEVTEAGVIRTARHYAINQYWSLAQFFTQEISDNADTIANNLYAITLTEMRAGAAKGGKDLPVFRVEKAEGFSFNL